MENVKINIYSKFLYLKNKLTYKNILKAIVIIATIVIAYNCLTKIAYADGFLSYGNSDDPYKNIPEFKSILKVNLIHTFTIII